MLYVRDTVISARIGAESSYFTKSADIRPMEFSQAQIIVVERILAAIVTPYITFTTQSAGRPLAIVIIRVFLMDEFPWDGFSSIVVKRYGEIRKVPLNLAVVGYQLVCCGLKSQRFRS